MIIAFFDLFISNHLSNCVGTICSEDLVEVGGDGVVFHGAVAHDEVGGPELGDSGDGLVADILVKAGDQEVVRYVKDLLAGDGALFDLAAKEHAEVKHHLEEQILGGAILFDIALELIENRHLDVVGIVVYVLHIGRIELQNTKTGIKILCV